MGEAGSQEPLCSPKSSTACCLAAHLLRPERCLPHPCLLSISHFLSVPLTREPDLPRLIGDLMRPDAGHPPASEPDPLRDAQMMSRGQEDHLRVQCAGRGLCPESGTSREGRAGAEAWKPHMWDILRTKSYRSLSDSDLTGCPVHFLAALLQRAVLSQAL